MAFPKTLVRSGLRHSIVVGQSISHVQLFVTPWSKKLPWPSLPPRVCSNSCPLNQWCHPTISSSVVSYNKIKDFPAVALCILSTLFSCSYLDWNHHCIFRIKQIVILRFQFYLTNLRKFNHYSNPFLVFWFWWLTSSSLRNFFFSFVNGYKG